MVVEAVRTANGDASVVVAVIVAGASGEVAGSLERVGNAGRDKDSG